MKEVSSVFLELKYAIISGREDMKKTKYLLIIIIFALIGCKSTENQLYHNTSFFTDNIDLSIPVKNRIQAVPENVISWLENMDSKDNYISYIPTNVEKELFFEYFNLLPEKLQKIVKEKVIVVYFIENFMGGGMTYPVFDNKGNMYIIWIYNTEILRQNISSWINYRENSYFDNDLANYFILHPFQRVTCFWRRRSRGKNRELN